MRIKIRQARLEDIDAYIKLQSDRWSDSNQATREQLLSRFSTYPEGMLIAERNHQVVGMVYAMRITSYDIDSPKSWYEVTNNGYCDNHDPNGNLIFGVDLSTLKGVGGEAGDRLLTQIGRIAIANNIKYCMLGGRMPGYYKFSKKMTADEYLNAKNSNGEPLDRQVRYYTSTPGLSAIKPIPEYFKDPESCNYGVLLRWRNPFYSKPLPKLWSTLFPLLFELERLYLKITRS